MVYKNEQPRTAYLSRGLASLENDFIATDCMLGGRPNHGWQLCFPL